MASWPGEICSLLTVCISCHEGLFAYTNGGTVIIEDLSTGQQRLLVGKGEKVKR